MTQTEHYQLNQWLASDRVHHDDFNADNLKIDEALHTLDTLLSKFTESFTTSLAGKLGCSQLIESLKSDGSRTGSSFGYPPPTKTWSDWEYICILVQYPGITTESTPLSFNMFAPGAQSVKVAPLALPGYLVVFLPWHDRTKPAVGFVVANRFVPFSCPFSFDSISQINYATQNYEYTLVEPNIVAFGGT